MSVWAEASAAPHVFEHKGKTYNVSLINQDLKVKFEDAMFRHAKGKLAAMRDVMDAEHYELKLEALYERHAEDGFSLDNEQGVRLMTTRHGQFTMLGLILGCDRHEAIKVAAERQTDITALLKMVFRESFPDGAYELAEGGDEAEKKVTAYK